jgi:putative ABC transport system substrate-binding protein
VFRRALSNLGHTEGQNLLIDYRFAGGDISRLPHLAAELVAAKVDVIVAVPTAAVVAASNATKTIPIVMMNVGDPVGLGLIASLSKPAGNVTGLSFTVGVETFAKALELLTEAAPDARQVAILTNPANPAHARVLSSLEVAATALNLRLQRVETRIEEDFERAFDEMATQGTGAMLVIADVLSNFHRERVASLALKYKVPSMHQLRAETEAGGLMSYGPHFMEPWSRAAAYVDKLLNGANPGDLPVQQPTKFELVINLKTARALGLIIPPTLLARADEVIE